MNTKILDEELAEYGSFEKKEPSHQFKNDVEITALHSPEEEKEQEKIKIKQDLASGLLVRAMSLRAAAEAQAAQAGNADENSARADEAAQQAGPVDCFASAVPEPVEGRNDGDGAARKEEASDSGLLRSARNDKEARNDKVRHPIGVKLILLTSLIVLASMGLITVLVSYFISSDTRINAEDNNLTINSRTASDCQSRLNSIISSSGILYDILITDTDEESQNRVVNSFFDRNKYIAAIYFQNLESSSYNRQFFATNELENTLFDSYVLQEEETLAQAKQGSVKLLNASQFFGVQIIAIFTPVYSGTSSDAAVILFACDELSESFANSSINSSILVNDEGVVLVHPDIQEILNATDLSKSRLVETMLSKKTNNEQFIYKDDDGVEYIAAFRKINLGGCGVVTEVRTSIVLEAVNATTRRNIYLTVSILSFAIILIWFFAKSLSSPLKTLTSVVNEINNGNFNTEKFEELPAFRSDEIGVLVQSTKNEREILNTVTSLTNRGVTQAIIKKEIDFEPHLKDITIFFSDIRGFTAISDGFNKRFGEKSAAEIISFLNDYMGRMVNCINITGGNVDKFEGDAIMACWGVLRDDDLSFESMPEYSIADTDKKTALAAAHAQNVQKDALSAIRATVAMRYALMEYNKHAEEFTKAHAGEADAKYKPHIRIGSGLNSGRATVGCMGSYHKMEFTSI
ncbi:MAG: adenylate/guanylate cyclase domain-containing protein, partial [Treponema sp.]|nr:adenylate/guanylate cyclase domain-containing protein [Treponema sp.]